MDYWQFSSSSLPLLERCLNVPANENVPGNKWKVLFKRTPDESPDIVIKEELNSSNTIDYDSDPDGTNSIHSVETIIVEEQESVQTEEFVIDINKFDKIHAELEASPNKLELLSTLCDDDNLLHFLAEKLTKASTGNLLEDIIHSQHIESAFVRKFFLQFVPVYIKRETACAALDLLIKTYKAQPESFTTLMVTLLMDTEMTTKVLEEFFITVDTVERSRFLQELAGKEISKEAFIQHLNTVSLLFKSSEKSYDIQNFILDALLKSASACSQDKNYGRLLLMFFQAVKETKLSIDKTLLEQLLQTHETAFKRPCVTIFSNI